MYSFTSVLLLLNGNVLNFAFSPTHQFVIAVIMSLKVISPRGIPPTSVKPTVSNKCFSCHRR